MNVKKIVRIEWTVFEKIEKRPKIAVFANFLSNFGYVFLILVKRF